MWRHGPSSVCPVVLKGRPNRCSVRHDGSATGWRRSESWKQPEPRDPPSTPCGCHWIGQRQPHQWLCLHRHPSTDAPPDAQRAAGCVLWPWREEGCCHDCWSEARRDLLPAAPDQTPLRESRDTPTVAAQLQQNAVPRASPPEPVAFHRPADDPNHRAHHERPASAPVRRSAVSAHRCATANGPVHPPHPHRPDPHLRDAG